MTPNETGDTRAQTVDAIHEQTSAIESAIGDLRVLMTAIIEKLDAMDCDTPKAQGINSAIDLFARTAQRSVSVIDHANSRTIGLLDREAA